MSNNFTNKTALCTAVMVCPLLAFLSHADGHTPWLVAALQALLAVIAALVVIVVATLIVALITDIPRYIANRRENRTRPDIEQRFPGTRATSLKSGHWLLTERSTGRTQCELECDGVTLGFSPDLLYEAAMPARPSDDTLWDQTLRERDHYRDQADKLSGAIAKRLGVDIGEHSNVNAPWANALEAIESAPPIEPEPAASAYNSYPGSNHEIIEKALYCNEHGDAESVENWLGHLRDRLTLAPAISLAASDVILERLRQLEVEGWTPEHDDGHTESEMALAAACYSMSAGGYAKKKAPPTWPWSLDWWKPAHNRRDLVKAGALNYLDFRCPSLCRHCDTDSSRSGSAASRTAPTGKPRSFDYNDQRRPPLNRCTLAGKYCCIFATILIRQVLSF